MPPRRSVGRNATATPARSTRATGVVPINSSATRRVTRASSQQPGGEDAVANPQLPELQTQQSYAYGSTKTPVLPEQLVARDRMSLGALASTIEQGVQKADQRFQDHNADAQANLDSSPPAARTRRKTSRESSKEPSQQPLQNVPKAQAEKDARVAAWADSLESEQLEVIREEGSESEAQDNKTQKDTDPSSLPDGIFDRSYNYERGVRKLRPLSQSKDQNDSFVKRAMGVIKDLQFSIREVLLRFLQAATAWTSRLFESTSQAIRELPDSSIFIGAVKVLVAMALIGTASFLFCFVYARTVCNPASTSLIATNLQKFCGSCAVNSSPFNLSEVDSHDFSKLTAALSQINKQIADIEKRLTAKIDTKHHALESEMNSLRRQHTEITGHLANIHRHGTSSSTDTIASPLIAQVNFFAPSNGAIINYQSTSPTRQKSQSLPLRVFKSAFRMARYTSRPPITALEPWHDVGDCWCASDVAPDQDFVRLSVTTREMIYPTELIVEHFPAAGSLDPTTGPKDIEIWANFSHLDMATWRKLGLSDMQDGNVLGEQYALLGRAEYKMSRESHHVQSFRLDVNQQGLFHFARTFVLRVRSSWGSEHVCLYRVRLHGVGVDAAEVSERDAG